MTAPKQPRRISVESGDAGHLPYALIRQAGREVAITLDGEPQTNCVTADAVEGFVKRYVDESRICDGVWPVEVAHGKVTIKIIERTR